MYQNFSLGSVLKINLLKRVLAVSSALCTFQLAHATEQVKEIKVGVVLALTGGQASYSQDAKKGIELALEQLGNSEPKIKLIIEDSQSTPSEAAKATNKLITSDKVPVIIGEMTSSNTIAAASIAEKAGIPIISPAATADSLTQNKKFVYRTCFVDSFQGTVMAKFAHQNLNAKTAVILLNNDSDYSRGLAKSFENDFTRSGAKVLKTINYSEGDINFIQQLSEVRRIKPDIVFIPGYEKQVGVILNQAKNLKIESKMLGADGWDTPELKKIAKGAEIGGYISSGFSVDSTEKNSQDFVKAYEAKYKSTPSTFAALGYDTLNLVRQAIINSNSVEPAKINEALANTKNFSGVTGTMSIDKNHNANKSAIILQFTETGYKYVTSIQPVSVVAKK